MKDNTKPGKAYPIGASVEERGVNFSVFSKNATRISLLFFDQPEDEKPSRIIELDPKRNRSYYYWHVFVEGVEHGQLYGYIADGISSQRTGHLFDLEKLLVDPYARAIAKSRAYDREAAKRPGNNFGKAIKSVVVDTTRFNWTNNRPEIRPLSETVIYEMHVAGFTSHPSSGVKKANRGTYKGVIEKIPYLKSMGITAVELMPVQCFDVQDSPAENTLNYWGYTPINFFAPHAEYASTSNPLEVLDEFRSMVNALHAEGIEVILDVVFNHTTEGGSDGPILSFKGLENNAYYLLDPNNRSQYLNFSGTGNTVNANHSIVRRMVRDCLRYWVSEMHIDGFRFDLAAVLSRDEEGHPLKNPPLIWEIESDPVLSKTKLIAEAWDAGGLNQMGNFTGDKWAEWNGAFRDDARRFWRGDNRTVPALAKRISGSGDFYNDQNRDPNRSIHFIACHDGFTLNDLVSYNKKHNEANGEQNKDGMDENFSWNCGVEGETDDPEVNALRERQIKNFLCLLFLSQGTPMMLMGDECRRSQLGNNNAYNQDNEISWMNWNQVKEENELVEFTRQLIHFTQKLDIFRQDRFFESKWQDHLPFIEWHGIELFKPDWSDHSHSLAFTYNLYQAAERIHVMLNAYKEPLTFEVPEPQPSKAWHQLINTSLAFEQNFNGFFKENKVVESQIMLPRNSLVLLMEN